MYLFGAKASTIAQHRIFSHGNHHPDIIEVMHLSSGLCDGTSPEFAYDDDCHYHLGHSFGAGALLNTQYRNFAHAEYRTYRVGTILGGWSF